MSDQSQPATEPDGSMGSAFAALQESREPEGQPEEVVTEVSEEVEADSGELEELDANLEEESEDDAAEELTFEVDGETYNADDIQELKRGNMMEADYRKKTTEVAQKRRVVEQQEQTAAYGLGLMQQEYVQKIERFRGIDFERLARENPGEYQAQMASKQQAEQRLSEVQRGSQQFLAGIKEREEAQRAQNAEVASQTLKREIKGWDEQVYYKDLEHAELLGMDKEAAFNETNPAVLIAFHKARLFDEGMAVASKKRGSPTKTLTQKGAKRSPDQVKKADAQLHKSGSMDDALNAMRTRRRR